MSFKDNVKYELECRGMMIKELAIACGISRRTLDNYLRENESQPTVENAVKIAKALGVTVEYLVTGNEVDKNVKRTAPKLPEIDLKLCKKYYSTILELNEIPENAKNLLCKLISEWKKNNTVNTFFSPTLKN